VTAHKTRERDRKRTDPTTLPDVNFRALSLGDVIDVGDQFYDHVNAKWVVVNNDQAGRKIGMSHVAQWRRQVHSFIGGGCGYNGTIEVSDHDFAADGTDEITGPQWRDLERGEIIQKGDEWQVKATGKWHPAQNVGLPFKAFPRYRRKVEEPAVVKLGNVLHEADKLVHGDRGNDYGSPREDFERTAKMMSAVLGTSVTAEQVPLLMICVKLSRQCHKPKRDNLVDIAGYAETAGMLEED